MNTDITPESKLGYRPELDSLRGISILLVYIHHLYYPLMPGGFFSISKQDWQFAMTGCIAFLLITIFLNPVFLNNGIKAIGKMIEVRLSAFHIYQETYKDVALLSVSERFLTVTKMIFFRYSLFYNSGKIPIELIMFILGMVYSFRKKDYFLLSVFTFLVVISISFLPYNVFKYFYRIFPFTYIIAGLSFNLSKEILSRKGGLSPRGRQN
jgi:uncharacterized protein YacL